MAKQNERSFEPISSPLESHLSHDDLLTIERARVMVRSWATTFPSDELQASAATAFIVSLLHRFVALRPACQRVNFHLPQATTRELPGDLSDFTADALLETVARSAAHMSLVNAGFCISSIYTSLLPAKLRSRLGIYYTPPVLTERLLNLAEQAGCDWKTARVLDPACGGGAFLMPVAMRMIAALGHCQPRLAIRSILSRLSGFEIDPTAAWLSRSFLEIALVEHYGEAHGVFGESVDCCDALDRMPSATGEYDLVIGNPPYGRVKLTETRRQRYERSLYGHANLYGLFTDLAIRWTRPGGVIAFVTPTSFLAGQYFKALRHLIACEAPPLTIDIIETRKGAFEDVLQETMLSTYRVGASKVRAQVQRVLLKDQSSAIVERIGEFVLPRETEKPWLIPRDVEHRQLIDRLGRLRARLSDWGYKVSTGPLVWNRHKKQLTATPSDNTRPLIWAESIPRPGKFEFRALKANHHPYFELAEGDNWLVTDKSCVLVQRTTSKEQARRLSAAVLPQDFIDRHGSVVIENHLNMVRPLGTTPKVSLRAVSAFLNSPIADEAFRCISGSVAVSAFELESLPLPSPSAMHHVDRLVCAGASPDELNSFIERMYLTGSTK